MFFDWEKAALYTEAGRRAMPRRAADAVAAYYREILERRPDADFAQQMSYVELRNRLPELLLMRVDKFSMAHSLEARAPFLDHELASYALSCPPPTRSTASGPRPCSRTPRARGSPRRSSSARSRGSAPLPAWLRKELAPWAEGVLRRASIHQLGLFDLDHILALWRRHASGQADCSFDLWCLINLFGWYEQWLA